MVSAIVLLLAMLPCAVIGITVECLPSGERAIEWSEHRYVFSVAKLNWDMARTTAEASSTPDGRSGHLATVTSSEEHSIILTLMRGDECQSVTPEANNFRKSHWLGGADLEINDKWVWMVGPEAGRQFWQGRYDGVPIDNSFTHWRPGTQPNPNENSFARENCLGSGSGNNWNDFRCTSSLFYITEFEYYRLSFDNRIYSYVKDAVSFEEAAERASLSKIKGLLGHLATISSPEEAEVVRRVSQFDKAWLGGQLVSDTDLWTWTQEPNDANIPFALTNGVSYNSGFTNWTTGQPLVGTCLAIQRNFSDPDHQWISSLCDDQQGVQGFVIEYETEAFVSCPSAPIVRTTQDVAGYQFSEEEWQSVEPVATEELLFNGDLAKSSDENTVFPVGTTTVDYVLTVTALNKDVTCSFEVHIYYGTTTLAHSITSRTTPKRLDLIASSGAAGGAVLPSFYGNPLNGFSLLMKASEGRKFNLRHANNATMMLDLRLQWCTFGTFPEDGDPLVVKANFSSAFYDVEGIEGLTLFDLNQESAVTSDARCFRIVGQSDQFSMSEGLGVFAALVVTIAPTNTSGIVRRSLVDATYAPLVPSLAVLEFSDFQSENLVFVEDVIPPAWVGCPDDVFVTALPGTIVRTVEWDEPTATDNNKVAETSRSHAPGSEFNLIDSPVSVVYEATDASGLKGYCTFQVLVQFIPEEMEIDHVVQPEHLKTTTVEDGFGGAYVRDSIVSADSRINFFNDTSKFNSLSLSITAPPGQVFVVETGGEEVRLEMDLQWATDNPVIPAPSAMQYGSVALFGTRQVGGGVLEGVVGPSIAVDFPSLLVIVGPEYIRVQGASAALPVTDFSAEAIEVALAYPVGLSDPGNRTYNLTSDSSLSFLYQFSSAADAVDHELAVSLRDIEPPTFSGCPTDVVVNISDGVNNVAQVFWQPPGATDNLLLASYTNSSVPGDNFTATDPLQGAAIVVHKAVDGAGNVAYCNFSVTVQDFHPPVLVCPNNKQAAIASAPVDDPSSALTDFTADGWVDLLHPLNATDNSGAELIYKYPELNQLSLGNHTLNTTVTDPQGNLAYCVMVLKVIDDKVWLEPPKGGRSRLARCDHAARRADGRPPQQRVRESRCCACG
eukprot:m.62960 g.62960  ORF g.62960 m.62960 type:complete len:1119 (-) comp13400_c1_seq1:642-3998(-)